MKFDLLSHQTYCFYLKKFVDINFTVLYNFININSTVQKRLEPENFRGNVRRIRYYGSGGKSLISNAESFLFHPKSPPFVTKGARNLICFLRTFFSLSRNELVSPVDFVGTRSRATTLSRPFCIFILHMKQVRMRYCRLFFELTFVSHQQREY